MTSVAWNENLPSGTSAIKLGDNDIRTTFTNLRSAMSDEHDWGATFDGTAEDRGKHTPNASRISFGTASVRPADAPSGMSGMMYMESDYSLRAWAFITDAASNKSYVIGGARAIHADNTPDTDYYQVLSDFTMAPNSVVSMPVTFAVKPVVATSVETSNDTILWHSVVTLDVQSIGVTTALWSGGATNDGEVVHVLALGQVAV